MNKDIVRILDYALQHRSCLVLTNATEPLIKRFNQLKPLLKRPHPLHFRVSLDHFEAMQHDQGRGRGMFPRTLEGVRGLYQMGFSLSIASQVISDRDANEVASHFSEVLQAAGLPGNLPRIEFPEFHPPETEVIVPHITTHCMTAYQTEKTRQHSCVHSAGWSSR